MPKDQRPVLLGYFRENLDGTIYEEGGEPIVARWIRGAWWARREKLNSEGPFSPSHWMPLPEPPQLVGSNAAAIPTNTAIQLNG
jgi:hypothetical protein